MKDLVPTEINNLLNRIEQGDDKAVERLFRHYHAPLFRFICLRNVPVSDAEEIAQDVLLHVATKPQSFAGQSQFSTWLFAIAKFKVIDYHRKTKGDVVTERVDDAFFNEIVAPEADVLAALEEAQDWEAMLICIEKLPNELRDTVQAAIFDEDSMEEAAAHLGCPVGTVKSRLFNARSKLAECIQRWLKGGRHGV